MTNRVNINPKSFQDTPLCDLCFEEALRIGAAKSEKLKPTDFKETSIRFHVEGLYKWYKAFSKYQQEGSVYSMMRDANWWWASFCTNNKTLSSLVKEYYDLLKDITEKTDYTDLAERMDESTRIKEVGKGYAHCTILVPFEPYGIITDCATALGTSFSLFYETGLAKALASNRNGLYSPWVERKVKPLYNEMISRAEARLKSFAEIRNSMEFRIATDGK